MCFCVLPEIAQPSGYQIYMNSFRSAHWSSRPPQSLAGIGSFIGVSVELLFVQLPGNGPSLHIVSLQCVLKKSDQFLPAVPVVPDNGAFPLNCPAFAHSLKKSFRNKGARHLLPLRILRITGKGIVLEMSQVHHLGW